MREKHQKQMPLMHHIKNHPQNKELEAISAIIDINPTISEMALQDLTHGKSPVQHAGAKGMSADHLNSGDMILNSIPTRKCTG